MQCCLGLMLLLNLELRENILLKSDYSEIIFCFAQMMYIVLFFSVNFCDEIHWLQTFQSLFLIMFAGNPEFSGILTHLSNEP